MIDKNWRAILACSAQESGRRGSDMARRQMERGLFAQAVESQRYAAARYKSARDMLTKGFSQ